MMAGMFIVDDIFSGFENLDDGTERLLSSSTMLFHPPGEQAASKQTLQLTCKSIRSDQE
jgi:hypothetical protein